MTDEHIVRTLAERVMGWKVITERRGSADFVAFMKSVQFPYLESANEATALLWTAPFTPGQYWNPLTSISDAFMVVEKMGGLDMIKVDDGWMVGDGSSGFSTDDGIVEMRLRNFAIAETAPRAICLAAIAATEEPGK